MRLHPWRAEGSPPAVGGDEGDGARDALRREAAAQVGVVSGLGVGLLTSGRLGDGLGGAGWVGGRGHRGIGGIAGELGLRVADAGFQGNEALPQGVDRLIAPPASGTRGCVHASISRGPGSPSSATQADWLDDYPETFRQAFSSRPSRPSAPCRRAPPAAIIPGALAPAAVELPPAWGVIRLGFGRAPRNRAVARSVSAPFPSFSRGSCHGPGGRTRW
jgi:hypothetical protein